MHVYIFERVISQLITLCVVIAAEACSGLSIIHQRIVRAYLSATFSILHFEERKSNVLSIIVYLNYYLKT